MEASHLSCIKKDRILFDGLSLQLREGELMYLRGPNGAGKTSLLRILSGLSQPSHGCVNWRGKPLDLQWYREMVYVGHKPGMSDTLTAIENLRFWCCQHAVAVRDAHILDVLSVLGLVGVEDIPCRLLSAGQQRRVALAKLWLKPATVWLLDEPFTALDVDGVSQLEAVMCQHVKAGGAILTTSHQPLSTSAGPLTFFDLEYRI
nr:cytochrome c biogenesis heme-transporting ATPase CcmA [Aestuariibacter sp. A3R04]